MTDFFVSYNRHDRAWAEWIAWILEAEKYTVVIQAWDFRPGSNFVLEMQRATTEAERTIAVLSDHYLQSQFTAPEWAAAFAKDPTGAKGLLIPLRVGEATSTGLLPQINYVDLVGLEREAARAAVLKAVLKGRMKPEQEPIFPGSGTAISRRLEQIFPPDIPANLPLGTLTFVGRDQELTDLHQQLQGDRPVAISAISGMGGIGKTELAVQYGLEYRGAYPGGVCWLNARADIGTQILGFARSHLNLPVPEDGELAERVAWCWRNWPQQSTLIVLDDVQTYGDVQALLPPGRSRFKTLMTTRSRLQSPVQDFEIPVLSEGRALELLRAIVTEGRGAQDPRLLPEAGDLLERQICEWLGYLPLGIELVGRYLARKPDVSLAELWQRLQEQKLAARALLAAQPGMTATLGVTAAFEVSWLELAPAAQQLAKRLSQFALAEICWEWVEQGWPEADPEALEDWRDEALLGAHLLLRVETGRYQLHQLLREFFAAKVTAAERLPLQRAVATAMVAVAKTIDYSPTLAKIQAVAVAIPHLKAVAEALGQLTHRDALFIPEDDLFWAFTGIARFYDGQGSYAEAEPWYEDCLAVTRSLLGEGHPDVAISLNNLAALYDAQGRYEAAEPRFLEGLEMTRLLLGEGHPDVAVSLNNLAALYKAQGHYEAAEPLFVEALELRRSLLGESHPNIAQSLNNLAALYKAQGRYEDAEPLYLKALEMRRSLLGESHPDVATSLNNLAALYDAQGRYGAAEPLYLKALEMRRSLLGESHPDVASSLNNLAGLYRAQGRYEAAEPLYLQALEMQRSLLDERHPAVATSLNNLAVLYYYQQRFAEAEPLLVQALALRQQVLGDQHPHTLSTQQSLAAVRQRMT